MKKLLYVHGYLGNGNGNASRLVRAEIERRGLPFTVDAPAFPVTEPEKMMDQLNRYIREGSYDVVAASSMGAFYVMQADCRRILVNPAMPCDMRALRTQDPAGNTAITDDLLAETERMKNAFFAEKASADWVRNTHLIFGDRDEIAHNEPLLSAYIQDAERVLHVDMGHRMEPAGAAAICDILEKNL